MTSDFSTSDTSRSTMSSGASGSMPHTTSAAARANPPANAQPREQQLVVLRQQVVGPVDERTQRLLPLEQHPAAAGQQLVAILEPCVDVGDRERAHSCGGELDREWYALQSCNQFGHCGGLVFVERESGLVRISRARRTA